MILTVPLHVPIVKSSIAPSPVAGVKTQDELRVLIWIFLRTRFNKTARQFTSLV